MHAANAGLAEMPVNFLRVIVELISMGADVNAASRHGYTPLMLSARAGVARTFSDVHFLGGTFYLPFFSYFCVEVFLG